MDFILAAVDGTWSYRGYNVGYETDTQCRFNQSYVLQFHNQMQADSSLKNHFEGPGLLGTDVQEIADQAFRFVTGCLRRLPEAKVVLIGHSRGGHIAINIAQRLERFRVGDFTPSISSPGYVSTEPTQTVHYLGLYDAVDRSGEAGDTTSIPSNVVHMRHAIRDPTLGSRSWFGNTGTHTARTNPNRNNYEVQSFRATHGAVGGAVPHGCEQGGFDGAGDYCTVELSEEDNTAAGDRAHRYILAGARECGVPV